MSDTAETPAASPEPFDKPIYITRPFLPSIEEFASELQEIWECWPGTTDSFI